MVEKRSVVSTVLNKKIMKEWKGERRENIGYARQKLNKSFSPRSFQISFNLPDNVLRDN